MLSPAPIVLHYISIDRHLMKDIKPILHTLGLLDSEIKTYLAALDLGPSTAIDLTKSAHLSRQAVYLAIESLTERGIMSSIDQGKKKYYTAEHPSKLLAYARRREAEMKEYIGDLERSIPELELQMAGERPVVRVYEGKEGVRAIIEDMKMGGAKVYEEITDLDAMNKAVPAADLEPLRQTLQKAGIMVHGLYEGKVGITNVKSKRYALPKSDHPFRANITVYGNKIALVTFHGKMNSIIIESAELAGAIHRLFGLALETAEKKYPCV